MSMLNEARRGSITDDRDRSFMGRVKEILPWKGDSIKELIRKAVFIGAVCVLAYSAYDAYIYNFGSKTMINDQEHLSELYNGVTPPAVTTAPVANPDGAQPDTPEPDTPDTQPEGDAPQTDLPASKYPVGMSSNFEQLYDINPDIVGWIKVDGIFLEDTDTLAINYPVVFGIDNDHYLHYDFFGNEADYGTLFTDCRAKVSGEDRSSNVTIYGHNMKTEYYFHHLRDYNRTSPTFVSEHRLVEFDTLYSQDQYIIFGCFLVSIHEKDDNQPIFRYHNCIEFNTEADFDYWYKNVLYRNYYKTDIECTSSDEYLTLSTCAYDISDSRFVIVARKLREGEDPAAYTYLQNPDRHMPAKWYKAYGYTVPEDDGPDYEAYVPE